MTIEPLDQAIRDGVGQEVSPEQLLVIIKGTEVLTLST